MSRFVLRFDDVTPNMAWSKFSQFKQVLFELAIKPIIGVVPNCLDQKLSIESAPENFWEIIRNLAANDWTIAQHGYTHRYITHDSGLLKINRRSEFAGLSYDEQFEKLSCGKDILVKESVWQPVFMAPAHSFDAVTLSALAALNFKGLTDGYGVYPYQLGKLHALPNLFASPINFGFGVYTICLHINNMSQADITKTITFIKEHSGQFVSFNDALSIQCLMPSFAITIRHLSFLGLLTIRRLRR